MHDKAVEAAATAVCAESLTDNAGKVLPCTHPACDCDRAFIRKQVRSALRAFFAIVSASEAMVAAAGSDMERQHVAFEEDSPLWFPAQTFSAMSAKLADELGEK